MIGIFFYTFVSVIKYFVMTKKIIQRHRFHSSLLVPWRVIEESKGSKDPLEHILLWIDVHQSSHYFHPGDEAAHKDNLDQKIYVDKIIRTTAKENEKARIIGIDCHWFEPASIKEDA
jgi:hypothetical protein